MDWSAIAKALVNIVTVAAEVAPSVVSEAETIYTQVKSELSADDQASVDAALAAAQKSDDAATEDADEALTEAEQES